MRGRERVIRYVTEKWGNDRMAQIVTFRKVFARASARSTRVFRDRRFGGHEHGGPALP